MERSDELRDFSLGFYEALANGDVAFFDRHFSREADVRGIGTDPQEWRSGPRVAEVFEEQIEAMAAACCSSPAIRRPTSRVRSAGSPTRRRSR